MKYACDSKTGNDMPYTPPGGDDQYASVCRESGKYIRSEQP